MAYRQEYTNININLLCSDVYNSLSSDGNLVSTDFYFVGNSGESKKVYIGNEPVLKYNLSSQVWTFTLSGGGTVELSVAVMV